MIKLKSLIEAIAGPHKDWKKREPNWVPASAGQEKPFTTRNGYRLLYVWDTRSGRHAYLNLDTDIVLSDEEALLALGTTNQK